MYRSSFFIIIIRQIIYRLTPRPSNLLGGFPYGWHTTSRPCPTTVSTTRLVSWSDGEWIVYDTQIMSRLIPTRNTLRVLSVSTGKLVVKVKVLELALTLFIYFLIHMPTSNVLWSLLFLRVVNPRVIHSIWRKYVTDDTIIIWFFSLYIISFSRGSGLRSSFYSMVFCINMNI